MKLFLLVTIPCAVLGATLACFYSGHPLLGVIGVAFLAGWFGKQMQLQLKRRRILPHHDPNIPFTSEELKKLGIILPDPERYDCETFVTGKVYREWLDEYARR